MSGFGDDPFGRFPFGQSEWSRLVLFELLPGVYQQLDAENGGLLEKFFEGLREPFDRNLNPIDSWLDIRDPRIVRTKYDGILNLRLGKVREPESAIEQRGVDGSISGTRVFSAPTARFGDGDAGKSLTLDQSGIAVNNRTVKIAKIVSTTSVLCDPPLVPDPGPIRWRVNGFPDFPADELGIEIRGGDVSHVGPGWILFDGASEFEIVRRRQFFPIDGEQKSLTEREGINALVASDGRLNLEVNLTQQDVGKPITVSGSTIDDNNGKFQIFAVDPSFPNKLTLNLPLLISGLGQDPNGGVVYTYIPATSGVTVAHITEGPSLPLSVTVTDKRIVVRLQTDGAGFPISTAAAVAAAVAANPDAADLVTTAATGTGLATAGESDPQPILGASLAEDAGPLVWALLHFPELRIQSLAPPRGVVEQEGVDLAISGSPSNQVSALTAKFADTDVGKLLLIRGSTLGSDGVYTVVTFIDRNTIEVLAPTTLSAESNLTWELRTPSAYPDGTTVTTHAQPLIDFLAADQGLTIIQDEPEFRQRDWVLESFQWMDLKGAAKSYEIVGTLNGYNVTTVQLYRIGLITAPTLPPADLHIVRETAPGRFGADGRLATVGTDVHFIAASAVFKASDADLDLNLTNCNIGGNDAIFEIDSFVSPTEVKLKTLGLPTAPDNGSGGTIVHPTINWEIVRLYSDQPPTRARFDEVNIDLMQEIVGPTHFQVDHYCWESSQIESFTIDIVQVTPPTTTGVQTTYTVKVTGLLQGTGFFSTARVVGLESAWKIRDSGGTTYFLESFPVLVAVGPPESHTFQVFASAAPALGTATMTYICSDILDCGYCAASAVLVRAVGDSNSNSIASLRARLDNAVRPIHVRLVEDITVTDTIKDSILMSDSVDINPIDFLISEGSDFLITEGGDFLTTE